MKIGVFGDSYAERRASNTWWGYLSNYGHEVTCFGEGGSSIVWSAKQILDRAQNFDFIIWCVTSSNRITVWHRNNFTETYVHVLGTGGRFRDDPELQQKIEVTEKYIQLAQDEVDREFTAQCVVERVKQLVPNLLMVPCFARPVYDSVDSAGFNLFELYQKETSFYFPNRDLHDINQKFNDLRLGHFCESTHLTLAEQISKSLTPGIFSCDYSLFSDPTTPFDEIFKPRS